MGMFSFGEDDDTEPTTQQPGRGRSFSTGPDPVDVSSTWREFRLGFSATTVSIRSDQPILVSFDEPHGRPDQHIHVTTSELPFSIGGEAPVNMDTVWVKRADGATADAGVQIIAL
jgi:hypothetical protein